MSAIHLQQDVDNAPKTPGVYRFLTADDSVLYIGKAINLRNRLRSHIQYPSTSGGQKLLDESVKIDILVVDTEEQALILEAILVKDQQPRYNRQLRWGKSWRWLSLSEGEWPQLLVGEKPTARSVGPLDAKTLNSLSALLQRIYGLRLCQDPLGSGRPNPCMEWHTGRCVAPCTSKDRKTTRDEYALLVDACWLSMQGKTDGAVLLCEEKMRSSATEKRYESAAVWRDRAGELRQWSPPKKATFDCQDGDIILIAHGHSASHAVCISIGDKKIVNHRNVERQRVGISRQVVEEEFVDLFNNKTRMSIWVGGKILERSTWKRPPKELVTLGKKVLQGQLMREKSWTADDALSSLASHLDGVIATRIECYDVAHTGGEYPVCAMAVMCNGEIIKKATRTWNIASVANDDPRALLEALGRRVRAYEGKRAGWEVQPELIVIDGGPPQLTALQDLLMPWQKDGVTIWGLAKEHETFYRLDGRVIDLARDETASLLLQRLRDETHRRANSTHRLRRDKALLKK